MRAVVTGGAGFIGSHVVEALLARGDEVHVLDDLSKGQARERRRRRRRCTRPTSGLPTPSSTRSRPELVVHLAAQADVRVSVERPDHDADVNVIGTVRILEAARPPRRAGRVRVDRRRDLRRVRRAGAGDGGAAAARAVRHVEALRRGVPRDLEPPLRDAARRRFASATSTARGRCRTARRASSRSSWAS